MELLNNKAKKNGNKRGKRLKRKGNDLREYKRKNGFSNNGIKKGKDRKNTIKHRDKMK